MLRGFGLRNAVMSLALLATGVVSVPQFAMARDHHDRDRSQYYNNNGAYYGNNSGYRSRTYSNSTPYPYGSPSSGYRGSDQYYNGYYYGEPRSAGKSAAIIAGSAGAGAAVGALAGGTKGAIIGAAVGGIGGLVYDRTTRNNNNNGWGW